MSEKITDVNILEQSTEDMRAYAIYVIRFRSVPDIKDGLKPVIRKILWCSASDFRNQGTIKTASIVGQVMRKYNPHGDASLVLAIRNLINDFSTKYPLMEGSGGWGYKSNPHPSAPRYTTCKISQFAIDALMQDIYDDKRSIDWKENYDNKYLEPVYLAAKIPLLLILGQLGIAVGLKCSIPAHNLGQVIDTTIKLMRDPNAPFCLIPDECMPCELLDTDWQKICDTGMGTYIAQGIVDIGEYNKHPALFVRSLPDYTFFDSIKEDIINLVSSGKMPYIQDIVPLSNTDPKTKKTIFEEVIVLKKGTDPNFVKEFLYANTAIRQTRQVKMVVISDNKVVQVNYRQYLLEFIKFRRMTVFRKMKSSYQAYKTAIHKRELYLKAMTSGEIDKIIKMIRNQNTRDDQKMIDYLSKKLDVTYKKKKTLLDTNIKKLSKGYLEQYKEELKMYNEKIRYIHDLIINPQKIDEYIINEMLEIRAKYNDRVKCRIISKAMASGIAPGTFKLVFSKKNFVKKIGENENVTAFTNDQLNFVLKVQNEENVLVFSELGKVFKIPVHKIPLSDKKSNGIDIRILNKYCTSNICCAARETTLKNLAEANKKFKNFIFIITKNSYIKKIDIDDVITSPPSGIIFSKLDQGDIIKAMLFGPDRMDILIYMGPKVLRISPKDVPYLKRSTKGTRATNSNTPIDGMNFVTPNATDLVIITKSGRVNRIKLDIIPRVNRGRAGTRCIKLKEKDYIVSIWACNEANGISVIEDGKKQTTVPVSEIPIGSTISPGIPMFKNPTKVTLQC